MSEAERRDFELAKLIADQRREIESEYQEDLLVVVLRSTVAQELEHRFTRHARGVLPLEPEPRTKRERPAYRLHPRSDVKEAQASFARERLERRIHEIEDRQGVERSNLCDMTMDGLEQKLRALMVSAPLTNMRREALEAHIASLHDEFVAIMASAEADRQKAQKLRRERLGENIIDGWEHFDPDRPKSLPFPAFVAEQEFEWLVATDQAMDQADAERENQRKLEHVEQRLEGARIELNELKEKQRELHIPELKNVEAALRVFSRLDASDRQHIKQLLDVSRRSDLVRAYEDVLNAFANDAHAPKPSRGLPSFALDELQCEDEESDDETASPDDRLRRFIARMSDIVAPHRARLSKLQHIIQDLERVQNRLWDTKESWTDPHADLKPPVPEIWIRPSPTPLHAN